MLKRLRSLSQSSRASSSENLAPPAPSRPAPPRRMNLPLMRLALAKVAKGQAASLVTELSKACVLECGESNVAEGLVDMSS